jgi:transglutaminase-like putative cysteine protease
MTGHTRLAVFGAFAVALSSISLVPVISGGSWFWLSMVGLTLIVTAGELCRRVRLARSLIPAVQLSLLIFFFTAQFAGDEAILGFIPGGKAIEALGKVAASGFADIQRWAPPVPGEQGIVALTVAGVCLIGLMVDVLAVTMRRAALAGLPLLALYSVAAAVVRGGVHWLIFALAGFGYLALLLTEGRDRVSQWGRPLRTGTSDGRILERRPAIEVETSPLTQVGRRIGAAALGLAIVLPGLVPDLSHGIFGSGGGFGGGGSNRIATVNPIATLKQDLSLPENRQLLKVTTDNPNAEQQYLRDATLDEFNGEEWRPSKPQLIDMPKPLPGADGLSPDVTATTVKTRIEVSNAFRSQWLVMPQPAIELNVKGRWRYDPRGHDVIGDRRQTMAGLSYRVTSLDLAPTPEQLNSAGNQPPQNMSRYLRLPPMPPIVKELADRAVGSADTPYHKAVALQNWFLDNFQYSTKVRSGHSTSLIEQFLHKKVGYCEQFAATMAVMARMLDIPARVAVGFTAGQKQSDGSFVVKAHDRHAWPELYFEGVGWIRFEPTPSIDGTNGNGSTPSWARTDPTRPGADQDQAGLNNQGSTAPNPNQCAAQHQSRFDCNLDREQQQLDNPIPAAGKGDTGRPFPVVPVGVGGLLLILLALPWLVRTVTRRRRLAAGPDPEHRIRATWAELRDTIRDLGYAWDTTETPRQLADRLCRDAGLSGPAAEGLLRIARAAERLRYARAHGPVSDLSADVRAVRDGLKAGASRFTRWRAALLPPSSTALLSMAGERVADVLDWVDGVGGRLRAAMFSRRQRASS